MKQILSNQRGIALMMIMTAILFLTVIYGDFTFESKISRMKATNIMDRTQAKLLAESGLQMAMTRLRLYKEAYNTIQGNPNYKQAVPPQLLNQLWEVPYMFPIPLGQGVSRTFKDSVDKFMKESLMDGEIRVTVQNISNRLNLNMLRLDMQKLVMQQNNNNNNQNGTVYDDAQTRANYGNQQFSVDNALYMTMKRLVDQKREKDDGFDDKYGNINYQTLFANLRYYMSDIGTNQYDPMFGEAEQTFQRVPLHAKHGPMTSATELYTIPGWDDALIELIQNEFSVYPTTQIDLNKITANFLKILFPSITENDIKEFFIYRDDPQNPKFFNSIGDLKKYWVDIERRFSSEEFDARIKMLEGKGISFGSNPNLFKVIAEGISNRSTYTLVATVVLPTQQSAQGTQPGQTPPATQPNQPPGTQPNQQPGQQPGNNQQQNSQLLDPRVVEIQVN
jgi:type II secretory pathway component PulK